MNLNELKDFWCRTFHNGHSWRYISFKRKGKSYIGLECRYCKSRRIFEKGTWALEQTKKERFPNGKV